MKNKVMLTVGIGVCSLFMVSVLAQETWRFVPQVQVEANLGAADYHARAQALITQADGQYNPDFFDQFRWQEALAYANAALQAEPSNPLYIRTMAYAYTKTQFWTPGYELWKRLEAQNQLDPQDRQWAALSAAKLGYLRLMNNLPEEASAFLQEAQRWQNRPETAALLERARLESNEAVGSD